METIFDKILKTKNEIVNIEAYEKCSKINFSNGKKTISAYHIMFFDRLLIDNFFVRIHRKHLVNINHITYFDKVKLKLSLKNNTTVSVSKKQKHYLIKKINMKKLDKLIEKKAIAYADNRLKLEGRPKDGYYDYLEDYRQGFLKANAIEFANWLKDHYKISKENIRNEKMFSVAGGEQFPTEKLYVMFLESCT